MPFRIDVEDVRVSVDEERVAMNVRSTLDIRREFWTCCEHRESCSKRDNVSLPIVPDAYS